MPFEKIREECCQANLQLVSHGLVDMTFGNASVFDPTGKVFAIKPSGVSYTDLQPEQMVVVDLDGKIVDGKLRYSSDTPTHRCLYLAFEQYGVRSIVHTHSRNAVAFAQAKVPLPCLGTTHADFFNGPVPVTRELTKEEVSGDYEWETGNVIVEAFEELDPAQMPAVLVAGHGPFAWGDSATKAVEHGFALEVVAEMAIKTLGINSNAKPVPDYLLAKHFNRKHGESAYYGQRNDS